MPGIGTHKQRMVDPARAPGQDTPMPVRNAHHVHGRLIAGELQRPADRAVRHGLLLGRGSSGRSGRRDHRGRLCRRLHAEPDLSRSVFRRNRRHAEVVLVAYDPARVSFDALLKTFWESHDPTQGMRQGNDAGTQYRPRSTAASQAQYDAAIASRDGSRKLLPRRLRRRHRDRACTGVLLRRGRAPVTWPRTRWIYCRRAAPA